MKPNLLKLLDRIIEKLQSFRLKHSQENEVNVAYSSLSPIDNSVDNNHYSNALLWALKNRRKEDIKNLALTGSYGSGKSSILKTFQKNYKGKDLKFLNISLATFKDEKPLIDKNGKEIKVDKTEQLRLIETSILEQIFYHEEDKKIPDSRFKKIRSYSVEKLVLLSFGYLFFSLSIYNYLNPEFIQEVFKDHPFSENLKSSIHYIGMLFIFTGVFFVLLKSIRILSAITLNKLKIKNAEIGIGENLNKSILNHHIDEILYFFSIRPYNVVIIEDLDRFQETEIFTKLRELNLLLNNSKKTKRKEIVFVYAVRDDMFTDKDRTKFFDFIIPVIPIINSSNSSEILLKKKEKFQYDLSESLIEDLSFFIDDMRLLQNISNEFFLYREKLNKSLNQDKLFAIITYKNIYPNDFMKLSNNEGELYNVFNSKVIFFKNVLDEKDIEIEDYKNQINKFESIFINNLKDLRLLYVVRIIEHLPGFKTFILNDKNVTIDEVLGDENFEYLKTDKYSYEQLVFDTYHRRENTRIQNLTKSFNEIETLIDQSKSYSSKENEIKEFQNGKIKSLKIKIQELEKDKQKIRTFKIAELLRTSQLEMKLSENFNIHFIDTLLKNGYIDEDYIDYISLFHEGSITRSDHQFHISVKNESKQPYNYKLNKIEKLIQKINPLDFQTEYILNFDILNYMLSNQRKYTSQLESIYKKLGDESKVSIEFIKDFYETTPKLEVFLKTLCNKWRNIWSFIDGNPDFPDDLQKMIFKNIIEYGDTKDIIELSNQSSFKKHILSNDLFLNITNDHAKLKKIIEELDIEFTELDFNKSSEEMLSFVYTNSYYQLNIQMIKSIIDMFGDFNQVEFDNSNYSAVSSSKAESLIEYIEENINEYIENIYLKISTNINEKEGQLIKLLNNKNIEIENKESIISQINTKIEKLSSIIDFKLYSMLLEGNKLLPSWSNLLHAFNYQNNEDDGESEKEISESIIEFINIIQNATDLSDSKIPKEINDKNIYGAFWKKLIQINSIQDESYDLITKSSPWAYSDLNFADLSENKIKSLINNNVINPVLQSFILLKESFDDLHIYLLEKKKIKYLMILDQILFDSDDIELILESAILNNTEKVKILIKCSEESIITNNNLKLLSSILLADKTFVVSDNVVSAILINIHVPVEERIKLFIMNSHNYDIPFIQTFLTKLGDKYAIITDTSKKALLPKNNMNAQLLSLLVEKGYISSFSQRTKGYRVNHKRS